VDQSRYSFILHIWFEQQICPFGQQISMRGSLQQVASDRLVYFDTLERFNILLAQITGWQEIGSSSESS